jgi:acyl-CoA thioester hydrolase
LKHQLELAVRHYECDAYNHVNNATYLNYLEYAREQFLFAAGLDYPGWMAQGNGIWISEAHLVYQSPALAGETLTIESHPEEIGGATVTLSQLVRGPQDRPVLAARVKLVWVSALGRPTRIPASWKLKLTTGV